MKQKRSPTIKKTKHKLITRLTTSLCATLAGGGMLSAHAQDVLPFPDPPMGGKVGPTMQESVHKWREEPSRLPADKFPLPLLGIQEETGFEMFYNLQLTPHITFTLDLQYVDTGLGKGRLVTETPDDAWVGGLRLRFVL